MRFWKTWCCCALALACLGFGHASAHAQDPWLGLDKGKHFGASAVAAGGGYAAALLVVDEPWHRAALGAGFGFSLGIAKEIYDATGRGDPSWRDLTWDLIGCAFGVSVGLLLDYALRAPPRREPTLLRVPSAW
jgi:putative lipoprotein